MAIKLNQYHQPIAFHPGETLNEKLEELEMSVKEFAIRIGKPEKTVIAVMKGKSSVTSQMALSFERVLGIPVHFWLSMQSRYNEFLVRKKESENLEELIEWSKNFPVNEMMRRGWIPTKDTWKEKAIALLEFFSISDHEAWTDLYFEQHLKLAFRISLKHSKNAHAISAWLRKGELQARELQASDYDERKFKLALPEIKNIMVGQKADFFNDLQRLCLNAGVKVVHTPCIKETPINGCTRWLNDTPLIQLSGRYKRNDIFWFTFFHEAGHILLHGKKDIFLESIEYEGKNFDKEKEADGFAVQWTLSDEQELEVLKKFKKPSDAIHLAKKFNTHPAIIIGRLHRKKKLLNSQGKEFFVPISFE